MKISELITEELYRFRSATSLNPDFIFLGSEQVAEIEDLVAEMMRFGLWGPSAQPIPRATFMGMQIFRVDAQSHLSFGTRQPSPCG